MSFKADIHGSRPVRICSSQVRLPVVVIQPDNEVEHARAESRFFPSWASVAQKQVGDTARDECKELELPNTPNKGAYYTEGNPVSLLRHSAPRLVGQQAIFLHTCLP
jgi:hypothetical protein